jgi:hypothetical protein
MSAGTTKITKTTKFTKTDPFFVFFEVFVPSRLRRRLIEREA